METIYLLFDGSSVDGMGEGKYIGRTTDEKKAIEHFDKCRKDPYSTGSVMILTETMFCRAWGYDVKLCKDLRNRK